MAKKLYKKTGNNTYEIQGILPTETEWGKVVLTDTNQTITGTKTFDVAYANVFATGEGEGNYFQCRKFRGEGDASTYYHALEFGYSGHNQWDFFEYGGIYNFYQNTTSDGSGKVNLFQISPDGVTSHKPFIAESTLTAKGSFTSSASTTLSHIKNAGILGTDSSGKVCDNSSKYQKAGDYATSADINNLQTQLNAKLDKTTYEWNKEFAAGSNGAISLGRYNIYDSQLTFDITSTTNQSISGKLVIATQNGTIHQAKVFGDASGALVSKLIIYQSAISNSRSWVEVFCNFNGWSKNKVHIYAVALNSATVQKQMTSVTISNGVPAAANVTSGDTKWTGTIVNDFSHSHSNYVTTNTKQSITGQKTFDATPVLSKIKGAKVVGTDANGLIEAQTLTKNDVGLGNVDNTADQNKSVNYASGAGKIVSRDKNDSFSYEDLSLLSNHAKVYHVDTSKDASGNVIYYNPIFKSDKDTISVSVPKGPAIGVSRYLYDDNVGRVLAEDLKMGDIIITNNYPPRYISKKVSSNNEYNVEFTILKNPSDGIIKITGSSGFEDSNWHYRKIGHFIFNSSDSRNGAPVHLSGVIGDWAQGKMIFDIFVCTRGHLKVNGFVRGTNPSCRLVIDNTENPNIFLAVNGFATYNITVNTFENAHNENNAVRGSFHIDWTGGDDFSGSDVGVTATNFAYKDLLNKVAAQRAAYNYDGAFSETSGTMTKLWEVGGEETGKIICVHGKATSASSELSIQRKNAYYHDYDCIAVAPTGYNSGTYISCTGVVPPRLRYDVAADSHVESTYYIFGKNVSEVYVITFDLP